MKVKSLFIEKLKGLRDFNIDFNEGVTVLIGENGTGKTTILETIYNILTKSSQNNFDGLKLKVEFSDRELEILNRIGRAHV